MRFKQRVYISGAGLVIVAISCWLAYSYPKTTPHCSRAAPQIDVEKKERLHNIFEQVAHKSHIVKPVLHKVSDDLTSILDMLTQLQQDSPLAATRQGLHEPIAKLAQVLEKISHNKTTENKYNNDVQTVNRESMSTDVCPETYASSDLSGGYPFFYKGFDMQNCTNVPPFSKLVTVLFNMANATIYSKTRISTILTQVDKLYPNIPILVATAQKLNIAGSLNVKHIQIPDSYRDTDIWNALIGNATTRYVFVARNVVHFTWHSRLERLVREITLLQATVVAGAYRYMSGKWNYGCHQTWMRNYTQVYKKGYHWSKHECMACDSIQGPFIIETAAYKKHSLPSSMSDVSGFEVWFQELKQEKKLLVSCPDSMFFVSNGKRGNKESWVDFAKHYQIELIKLSADVEFSFPCSEADVRCSKESGKALSHCCLHELSRMLKTFFLLCEEAGCLCEMQEGTLLGAVKFNGLLPWERDADVTFHSSNFTAIANLGDKFKKEGYTLAQNKEPWCCVDGKMAGGVFNMISYNWNMEIYGQHLMDSEKLLLENIAPTQVELDGQLIGTPTSPGLFSRNRYGYEIYQHAQHWMTSSQRSGWAFYKPSKFTECPSPGDHACLDQYLTDGNIQFRGMQP